MNVPSLFHTTEQFETALKLLELYPQISQKSRAILLGFQATSLFSYRQIVAAKEFLEKRNTLLILAQY